MQKLNDWRPQALALLRIVMALLFIEHGTVKAFGFPTAMPGMAHLPPLLATASAIELILGTLILLGLFTRLAAFICSGEMAVAYFLFHFPHSFWPIVNQGGEAIIFCFFFLYLVFSGPGAWSLDSLRGKSAAA